MTVSASAIRKIASRFPKIEIKPDEIMSRHCSFKIGGPAAAVVFPETEEDIAGVCELLKETGIKPFIMGNGTNLLFTDGKLDRVVIKTGNRVSEIRKTGSETLSACCGATLAKLAETALDMGLSGLEFACGIPGTLGGAVVMNAGAYGGEMKDVISRTYYLDEELTPRAVEGKEQEFSYRRSVFSDTDKTIMRCDIDLKPEDPEKIRAEMRSIAEKRRNSQPIDKPSAGSVFKRPENGYAAALIEASGLKGFGIGGAAVSEKHAGFIINRGNATFEDVIKLIEHIRETVYADTGVDLETEIKIVGKSQ
ncbi:MAG: UDP-N-acetylmuramate dehydrogenase [Oscillospiraceae bacterium]|nr:UDP-N-acetylmuramate dehydrogenase [Oscillospiraceae bacterium]